MFPAAFLSFSTVFSLFIAENDLSHVAVVGEMVVMSFTNTRMFLRSSGLHGRRDVYTSGFRCSLGSQEALQFLPLFNCSIIFFLGKGVGKNDLLAFALLHYLKQLFLLFEQANFCDQKQ